MRIDDASVQSSLRRERYRVHNEVQLSPFFSDAVEHRFPSDPGRGRQAA
jgi:hypothetical protein